MQITNLGQFNFYLKYLWAPDDFALLQTWLQNLTYTVNQGAFGSSVLSGLQVTAGAGLSVNTTAGIAVGDEGQVMSAGSPGNVALVAPVSAHRWDLIVIRPTLTDSDEIPQPTNPNVMVPLHELIGYELVDIQGAESINPVYPAKQDGDVILCGVKLIPSQVSVVQANIDYSQREIPNKETHAFRLITANYNMTTEDDTIDADATSAASGIITNLPPALQCFGEEFLVTKIDSSGNDVTVSGSDPINGLGSITLEAQWQNVHVRSVGTAWRLL